MNKVLLKMFRLEREVQVAKKEIERLRTSLAAIRDSTHTNAVALRGIAAYTLESKNETV